MVATVRSVIPVAIANWELSIRAEFPTNTSLLGLRAQRTIVWATLSGGYTGGMALVARPV